MKDVTCSVINLQPQTGNIMQAAEDLLSTHSPRW